MSHAFVYNLQRMSTKDGPGLRTTVFLKGCPLRCLWCSNPESQSFDPQLMVFEHLCTGCGQCVSACPQQAVSLNNATCRQNTKSCTSCGTCAPHCPAKARVLSGESMDVAQVMEVIRKDSLFYSNSDGGVTVGGGEPTASGEFLLELLRACRDEGFHTCVDTCGYCAAEYFDQVIPLTDLFLFDCKHMDPQQHKALTGRDNAPILTNLRAALAAGVPTRIRMPLMPGLNDSEKNISAMAALLHEYDVCEVEVMPYHAFGRNKYAALYKKYPSLEGYEAENLHLVLNRFAFHGLKALIV